MTRVALVTGGGTGIGAAVARRLAADGYDVAVTGRRGKARSRRWQPRSAASRSSPTRASRRTPSAPLPRRSSRFGGLDALVLNAGIGGEGSLLDLDPRHVRDVLRTNVTGAFLMARAAISHLYERRGAIVSIASVAGAARSDRRASPTARSKAALAMLTQCIALDHGPDGVRANCVCPGWVRTPMADRAMDWLAARSCSSREAAYAASTQDVPLRRPSTPEEIAGTVAWLLSDDASYVNGAVIPVDGGAHDGRRRRRWRSGRCG